MLLLLRQSQFGQHGFDRRHIGGRATEIDMAFAQIRGQFGQHGGGESANPGVICRCLFQDQGMAHA